MLSDRWGSDLDYREAMGTDGQTATRRTASPFVVCRDCREVDEEVNQRRCQWCGSRKIEHRGRR